MDDTVNNSQAEREIAAELRATIADIRKKRADESEGIKATLEIYERLKLLAESELIPRTRGRILQKWLIGNGIDADEIARARKIDGHKPTTLNLRHAGFLISATKTERAKRKRILEKTWLYYLNKLKLTLSALDAADLTETQRATLAAHFEPVREIMDNLCKNPTPTEEAFGELLS